VGSAPHLLHLLALAGWMITRVLQVSHLILISWVWLFAELHWEHLIWLGGISWKQFGAVQGLKPCMCTSWSVHSSHQSD